VTLGMAAAVLGCHASPGDTAATARPGEAVVARVDGLAISAADVAAQMAAVPGLDRRAALEERIVFELLAREAAARDLPPLTADERAALVAARAQRIVERDLEPHLTRAAIADADVRSLYERGRPRFVHGRLVQTAVAHIFTGARMKPEPRARAEQNARLFLAAVAEHPPHTAAELDALASAPLWSERKVGVTTVWQDVEGAQPFPSVVARALGPLKTPGALTGLIGDETGFYVAMYLAEKPAENRALADVAAGLRAEMYEPWRRQRFLQLAMELTAGHDIEAFPDLLVRRAEAP